MKPKLLGITGISKMPAEQPYPGGPDEIRHHLAHRESAAGSRRIAGRAPRRMRPSRKRSASWLLGLLPVTIWTTPGWSQCEAKELRAGGGHDRDGSGRTAGVATSPTPLPAERDASRDHAGPHENRHRLASIRRCGIRPPPGRLGLPATSAIVRNIYKGRK